MPENEEDIVPPKAPESFLDGRGNFKKSQPKGTVRFVGLQLATRRTISPNEWPSAVSEKNVKTKEMVVWDLDNEYTLDKGLFSDEQLEVLEADGQFTIS